MNVNKIFWRKNNIFHFDKLTSTNKKAFELIKNGIKPPFVVISNFQTEGRGRNQNKWESEPNKNLLCSVVFSLNFLNCKHQYSLLQIISLSILKTLVGIVNNVSIKWPNDICARNKKIAGILIESTIQGEYINYAICGVGININQKKFNTDNFQATSLNLLTGKYFSINKILDEILQHISYFYNEYLVLSRFKELKNNYTKHLYLLGEKSLFQNYKHIFSGKITGVDNFGRLGIEDETKNITYYGIDEISYVNG